LGIIFFIPQKRFLFPENINSKMEEMMKEERPRVELPSAVATVRYRLTELNRLKNLT
jgi:hypothetical protein